MANVILGGLKPIEARRLLTASGQYLPSAAGSKVWKAVDAADKQSDAMTDVSTSLLAGFVDGTDGFLCAPDTPVTIFFPNLVASAVGMEVWSYDAGAFKPFAWWDVSKKGEGRTIRIPANKWRVGLVSGAADANLEVIVIYKRTYGQL